MVFEFEFEFEYMACFCCCCDGFTGFDARRNRFLAAIQASEAVSMMLVWCCKELRTQVLLVAQMRTLVLKLNGIGDKVRRS